MILVLASMVEHVKGKMESSTVLAAKIGQDLYVKVSRKAVLTILDFRHNDEITRT